MLDRKVKSTWHEKANYERKRNTVDVPRASVSQSDDKGKLNEAKLSARDAAWIPRKQL